MHHYTMLRVLNASSLDEAIQVADRVSYEYCCEYNPLNKGVEQIKRMKGNDLLSLYLGKKVTLEETHEWIKKHGMEELRSNFNEDNVPEESLEQLGKMYGEEYSGWVFIYKIYVVNEEDLIWDVSFDVQPIDCAWDGAGVYEDIDLPKGKLNLISNELRNKKTYYNNMIVDAKSEDDKYGRIKLINHLEGKEDYLSIQDSLDFYPEQENEYIVYLECSF